MMITGLCFCAGTWLGVNVAVTGMPQDRVVFEVRDSAGVRIVESVVHNATPPHTLSGMPVFDHSGLNANDPFFELRGGLFWDDGSVVVTEATRVVHMDRSGKIVFKLGRSGEGPGEFRGIRGLAFANPDQLVVVDSRLRRLTVIRDGVVEDARQIRGIEPDRPWDIHALDSLSFILGTAVTGSSMPGNRVDGRLRLPFHVFRISRDGDVMNALPPFRGAEVVFARVGGTALFGEAPLSRSGTVAALGSNVVLSEGEGIEIKILDVEGGLERIYRVQGIDLSVDRQALEAYLSPRIERVPGKGPQEKLRDVLLDDLPDQRPGVSALRVSDDGDIWVREYAFEGERDYELWRVIDGATGHYCGAWALPAGFSLWDIRGDEILGSWTSALGEESVRVYRWREEGPNACD